MLHNTEVDPTKLMLSPQGHSFGHLAQLNAGVILEPLISTQPIEELDPFVTQGLASLSGHSVKAVIADHAELGDAFRPSAEFTNMLRRYKEIRCSVPPSVISNAGYPIAEGLDRSTTETQPNRTTEEIYGELLFGDGSQAPAFEKISAIIARNPRDPATLTFIEKLFQDNGFEIDHPDQQELRDAFAAATARGYAKHMLGRRGTLSNVEFEALAVDWTSSIPDGITQTGKGLRVGIVKTVIDRVDPAYEDAEFALSFTKSILAETDEIYHRYGGNSDESASVLKSIEQPLFERLLHYTFADLAYIERGLQEDGREIDFTVRVANGSTTLQVHYATTARAA